MYKVTLKSILFFTLLYLLFPYKVLSAYAETELRDTVNTDVKESKHSLYPLAGFGSNMVYLGSTISHNQPFMYSGLAYGFNNEFFLSASSFHLSGVKPFFAFHNFSLSYNHVFNSWLDMSFGAYRYQVDKTLTDSLFNSFFYSDIVIGIDWKLLYSKLSFGGFLMKDPQTYFQIKNSRYFKTPDFFNGKAFISFDPYVNLLFGNLITTKITNGVSTITTTQQYNNPWNSGDKTGNSSTGHGTGYSGGYGAGSGSSTSATTTTSVPTYSVSYKEEFNIMQVELGLPVAFNLNSITIEAEAAYVLPTYKSLEYPGPEGFIFLLSGFFRIF
ncbi:MAG: hypothetical protein GT600_11765 [Bacteroidales bacterium]|jgi:hypothetical protein|nr:hypothetical protein [Bacteroidales bacterium]OQB60508.1 MAG: hypothetical protein BWX96_02156 [Bacteroidetes bacterium ADurb.Bin145]HOU03017.1 hypothetical protein [Bacteroidales bacterium]HQK69091.1 hypothetical protein [Bacteroidales bacterium]